MTEVFFVDDESLQSVDLKKEILRGAEVIVSPMQEVRRFSHSSGRYQELHEYELAEYKGFLSQDQKEQLQQLLQEREKYTFVRWWLEGKLILLHVFVGKRNLSLNDYLPLYESKTAVASQQLGSPRTTAATHQDSISIVITKATKKVQLKLTSSSTNICISNCNCNRWKDLVTTFILSLLVACILIVIVKNAL